MRRCNVSYSPHCVDDHRQTHSHNDPTIESNHNRPDESHGGCQVRPDFVHRCQSGALVGSGISAVRCV
jgi:hypothetical protein